MRVTAKLQLPAESPVPASHHHQLNANLLWKSSCGFNSSSWFSDYRQSSQNLLLAVPLAALTAFTTARGCCGLNTITTWEQQKHFQFALRQQWLSCLASLPCRSLTTRPNDVSTRMIRETGGVLQNTRIATNGWITTRCPVKPKDITVTEDASNNTVREYHVEKASWCLTNTTHLKAYSWTFKKATTECAKSPWLFMKPKLNRALRESCTNHLMVLSADVFWSYIHLPFFPIQGSGEKPCHKLSYDWKFAYQGRHTPHFPRRRSYPHFKQWGVLFGFGLLFFFS